MKYHKPLTNAEKQARHRQRNAKRVERMREEANAFVGLVSDCKKAGLIPMDSTGNDAAFYIRDGFFRLARIANGDLVDAVLKANL